MKKWMPIIAAVVFLGAGLAWVQGRPYQCGLKCGAKQDTAKMKSSCPFQNFTKDLNLTAEQQKAVDSLVAECSKSSCADKDRKNFHEKLERILTAEQYTQLKARCSQAGCPVK